MIPVRAAAVKSTSVATVSKGGSPPEDRIFFGDAAKNNRLIESPRAGKIKFHPVPKFPGGADC
jgi:hypothetical protein